MKWPNIKYKIRKKHLCRSVKSVGQKTIICEKNKTQRRKTKKSAQALETCTLLSYITNVITFFIKWMPAWRSNSISEVSLPKPYPFRWFRCTRGNPLKRKSNHDLYSRPRHTFPWRSCSSQGKLWKPSWCFRKLFSYLLSFN